MSDDESQTQATGQGTPGAEPNPQGLSAHVLASKRAEAARLAAALRANLQRRKAQARGRASAGPDESGGQGGDQ
ncbi:MAG: hypothetical protein JWM36_3280 [Hyphomicrobiales bacterium]|nr:hypothetical protein [Hyphomicrobiales bacterium]